MELMRGALRVVRIIRLYYISIVVMNDFSSFFQVLSVEADSLLLAPGSQKAWAAFNDKIMATSEVVSVVEQIRQEMGNK